MRCQPSTEKLTAAQVLQGRTAQASVSESKPAGQTQQVPWERPFSSCCCCCRRRVDANDAPAADTAATATTEQRSSKRGTGGTAQTGDRHPAQGPTAERRPSGGGLPVCRFCPFCPCRLCRQARPACSNSFFARTTTTPRTTNKRSHSSHTTCLSSLWRKLSQGASCPHRRLHNLPTALTRAAAAAGRHSQVFLPRGW